MVLNNAYVILVFYAVFCFECWTQTVFPSLPWNSVVDIEILPFVAAACEELENIV